VRAVGVCMVSWQPVGGDRRDCVRVTLAAAWLLLAAAAAAAAAGVDVNICRSADAACRAAAAVVTATRADRRSSSSSSSSRVRAPCWLSSSSSPHLDVRSRGGYRRCVCVCVIISGRWSRDERCRRDMGNAQQSSSARGQHDSMDNGECAARPGPARPAFMPSRSLIDRHRAAA